MTDVKDNELPAKAAAELGNDDAPLASDVNAEGQGEAADDSAGEKEAKKPRDPREEAVARYRAKRDRELAAAAGDGAGDGAGAEGADAGSADKASAPAGDDPAMKEARRSTGDKPAAPTPETVDQDTVEIKVFGKTERVTKDELIRRAQKASAADARLADANNLINELRAKLEKQPAQPQTTPTTPATEPAKQPAKPAKLTDEEAAKFARALQMGDETESRAAIQELYQKAIEQATANVDAGRSTETTPAATQPDITKLVDERLHQERETTSLNNDLEVIGKEFADVLSDPRLTQVAASEVHRLRADDLIASGYYTEQSTRQLESLARTDEHYAAHLASLHRGLELRGLATRRLDLFRRAGESVRQWYGTRPTATTLNGTAVNGSGDNADAAADTAKKVAAKQTLPKQPRATTKRTETKVEPNHEQRNQLYVRRTMKERGSLVTTRH